MDRNRQLIEKYAKRIYGFAWAKTRNYHDAEDLSQNILLELCKMEFAEKQIENMDSYIYRVCQYTWSNFVRKNLPLWQKVDYTEEIDMPGMAAAPEEEILKSELYEKLRREIMYLGRTKREAVIAYYYEGKSGKEIARMLGVPDATLRWYLGQSRKILKEGMEMNDTMYTPKRLKVYYCGSSTDINAVSLSGLRDDLLVQNICIVCEGKALSIEEIARTLCISAAFIEDKIERLVYMNYLEKVKNKYRTTFFIRDAAFCMKQKQFERTHLGAVADAVYDAVKKHLPDIRAIGFMGSGANENFLMWTFAAVVADRYLCRIMVPWDAPAPIRGDGSRHWIDAAWAPEEVLKVCEKADAELASYVRCSEGRAGVKSADSAIAMEHFDPFILEKERPIWNGAELGELCRVRQIIQNGGAPERCDREIAARLVQKGIVGVTDGRLSMLIPYFSREEYAAFLELLDNVMLPEVEAVAGTDLAQRYAAYIEPYIPAYLSAGEREFIRHRFYVPNAIPYLLYRAGKLAEPSEDEKKRVCMMVWERK